MENKNRGALVEVRYMQSPKHGEFLFLVLLHTLQHVPEKFDGVVACADLC
jgi:hypothetical protein